LPYLPLESIQNHSLDCTLRTRNLPTEIFGKVRCPILGKPNTDRFSKFLHRRT